ncbi:hypothetical protein GCM10020254_03810 [Streptomyces goshikiensis]
MLDGLDVLEAAVPGLAGRLDRGRVAVAGHSWGAQTASALLGARVLGPDGLPGADLSDPRARAGVLLALTGLGDDLTPFAVEHLPFMRPSFETMTAPALIVAGDNDRSRLSTRGPDWFTDPYVYSPAPKSLLTLFGAEHSLGGHPRVRGRRDDRREPRARRPRPAAQHGLPAQRPLPRGHRLEGGGHRPGERPRTAGDPPEQVTPGRANGTAGTMGT